MSKRIENYVNSLFAESKMDKKTKELKEEVLANCMDRYNDYLAEGHSEIQAFNLTVSNLGDIDELLYGNEEENDVKPVVNDKEEKYYRIRNARFTSIAVALFILSVISLIVIATIGESIGLEEMFGVIGLTSMFGLVAIGVGILIYINMSTPSEYKKPSEDSDFNNLSPKKRRLMSIISSIVMSVATVIFLICGFVYGMWFTAWIIFPICGISMSIVSSIIELGENHE